MPWLSARIVPSFGSVLVVTIAADGVVLVDVADTVAAVVAVDAAVWLLPELLHAPSVSPTATPTAAPRAMRVLCIDPPLVRSCASSGSTSETPTRIAGGTRARRPAHVRAPLDVGSGHLAQGVSPGC